MPHRGDGLGQNTRLHHQQNKRRNPMTKTELESMRRQITRLEK